MRYLIEPICALGIIKRNESFIAETNYPLTAVQIGQSEQFSAEHRHKASPRQADGEPAVSSDGFLGPRTH